MSCQPIGCVIDGKFGDQRTSYRGAEMFVELVPTLRRLDTGDAQGSLRRIRTARSHSRSGNVWVARQGSLICSIRRRAEAAAEACVTWQVFSPYDDPENGAGAGVAQKRPDTDTHAERRGTARTTNRLVSGEKRGNCFQRRESKGDLRLERAPSAGPGTWHPYKKQASDPHLPERDHVAGDVDTAHVGKLLDTGLDRVHNSGRLRTCQGAMSGCEPARADFELP